MLPLQLITGFFFNLFSLALIAAEIYFIREWYYHKDISADERYVQWCLAAVVAGFVLSFFGKFLWKLILGKKGDDEPNRIRSNETTLLQMPEGHKIFLEFYGPAQAQPIIFVHGWSSNSTQWYYLKKHLSKTYRLILMDLPGCGYSEKKKNNQYSPEKFAYDLEEVIKSLGNKKPVLVGHSIGGMTLLSYCKLFIPVLADKIAGLVLVQTTYTNPVKTSIMSGLFTAIQKPVLTPMCYIMIGLAPLVQFMNWIKFFNGSMHLNNQLTGYAGTQTKGQLDLTSFLSTVSPVGVIARGVLGMFEYDARATLEHIKVPVLVLAGNKDILCKPEASQLMASTIPDSKLVILQPSGHMGPLERNGEMTQAVDNFMKQVVEEKVFSTLV